MEPTNPDSTRKLLLLWSAPIVLGHFVAVIWHLLLLVKVQPSTPRFFPPVLILFNLFPVVGLVALAKGLSKLAASMIILPFAIALVIGTYAHFLSSGTDNILRMPSGDLRLSFQMSAVLLVLLDAIGCWVAIRIFAAFVGATCVEHLKRAALVGCTRAEPATWKEKNLVSLNIEATWANRKAKAVLLIRVLSDGFSFPKAYRSFCSLTPSESDAL
jgi:hypothetical protein